MRWAVLQTSGRGSVWFFFFRFVSVGLDGREQQQPQYQAPLSLSTHRIDRGGGCLHAAAAATAPAAAPAFVVERRESFFCLTWIRRIFLFFTIFFVFFSLVCFVFFFLSFLHGFRLSQWGWELKQAEAYKCTHYTRAAVCSCWRSWQDCR